MGEEEDGRVDERTSLSRLGVRGQWQGREKPAGKHGRWERSILEALAGQKLQTGRQVLSAEVCVLPTRCLK